MSDTGEESEDFGKIGDRCACGGAVMHAKDNGVCGGCQARAAVQAARDEGYAAALSDVQSRGVDMMMHAVGHLQRNHRHVNEPYRNHYCPGPAVDDQVWAVLVGLKLACVLRGPCELTGGATAYAVTPAGLEFLRALRRAERAEKRAAKGKK
jgi:hypothetical protein